MGGKTGTAEKIPRDDKSYLVSFIGFAPVENPELLIYCIIDEPNVDDQPHSSFAQNIVREILEEIMPYMNIYPDEETTGLHVGWDITASALERNPQVPALSSHKVLGPGISGRGIPKGPRGTRMGTGLS